MFNVFLINHKKGEILCGHNLKQLKCVLVLKWLCMFAIA